MKARIGTKTYDTDKCVNVCRIPASTKFLCMKKTRREFFIYDREAKNKYEMFQDIPYDEAKEIAACYALKDDYENAFPESESSAVRGSGATILFSQLDRSRIREHASRLGMSMSKFVLMLVDEYERNHDEG